MAEVTEGTTSLRDQLAAHLEETPAEVQPATVETPEVETEAQRAERLRDEKGRFAKVDAPKAETPAGAGEGDGKLSAEPPPESKPRPPRPSSWKKDYWDHWEKLDPALAEYINQREGEYAKGVSTYKAEAEKAKELWDVIGPYQQLIQSEGGTPAAAVRDLLQTAATLRQADPASKVRLLLQVAQQYQVPLQQFFSGQPIPQPTYQPPPAVDVNKVVESKLQEFQTQQEIQRFASDKEKHPHYDTVRHTMAGLLQSGLAENLEDAYQASLRLPQHSDIFDAMQKQQREADEKRQREEAAAKARQARANNISPKSATPSAPAGGDGKKGLRATLEAAADDAFAGRV